MILLKSTDTLQVLLAGTVTASQAVLYAAFNDLATDGSTIAPSNSNGTTNNTTAVSWVGSPATDKVRQVKYLSLYNADTASIIATVRINDGTNTRILVKFTLASGERAAYIEGSGFVVFASDGSPKGGAVTSINGLTGAVTLTGANVAEPVSALTISSGAVAINCGLGKYFTLTANANMTSWTFSNVPASGFAFTIMVRIAQDATGSRAATWPASLKWAGGTAGVLSTAASSVDVLALTTFDQGTTWDATLAKAFS